MRRKSALGLALAVALAPALAACVAPSKPTGTAVTHVSIQNPGGTNVCKFVLVMAAPKDRQILATATITCNFEALATHATLVVQGRKTGTSTWEDVDDLRESFTPPPLTITYTAICLPGYDLRAYASISGINPAGDTFKSDEATTGHAYTTAECNQ